jgi:hypothetical protein
VFPTGECWVPVNEDLRAMLLDGRLDPSSYHIAQRIVTRYSTHQSMDRLPFLKDESILQAHRSLPLIFVQSTKYYANQGLTPKICVYEGHGSALRLPMTACSLKERFTAECVTYNPDLGAKVFIDCTALDAFDTATTAPPSMGPNWTWMDWHQAQNSLSLPFDEWRQDAPQGARAPRVAAQRRAHGAQVAAGALRLVAIKIFG